MPFVWNPDPVDRQRSFLRGLMFLAAGIIVGILFSYGIAGVTQYSSVTVECMENGSFAIVDDSKTTGLVMILTSIFTLTLVPLLYCQIKNEYKRNFGDGDGSGL